MNDTAVPPWDGGNLVDLLTLACVGPMHFRNRFGDANAHDRAYGGQILGQALMAAAQTVSPGRAPTMMQFLFLQGTWHQQAIDLEVTALQDGKRFSSRHVRGSQQGSRVVLDAQVTFAMPWPAPDHMAPADNAVRYEDPDKLPRLHELPGDWSHDLQRSVGYAFDPAAVVDLRFADPKPGLRLALPEPRIRF